MGGADRDDVVFVVVHSADPGEVLDHALNEDCDGRVAAVQGGSTLNYGKEPRVGGSIGQLQISVVGGCCRMRRRSSRGNVARQSDYSVSFSKSD